MRLESGLLEHGLDLESGCCRCQRETVQSNAVFAEGVMQTEADFSVATARLHFLPPRQRTGAALLRPLASVWSKTCITYSITISAVVVALS